METNNKLREALTKILNLTNSLDENCAVDPVEICDIAKSALAEPVRNCEVGTAVEQTGRFEAFCRAYYKEICRCDDCPIYIKAKRGKAGNPPRCQIAWSQMPYKEGGVK